jgi:predicted amidophosphoribosyltransferase
MRMRIVQVDVEDAGLSSTDVSALIDLLVPPRCVGCDHPVTTLQEPFCPSCLAGAQRLELPDRGRAHLGEGVLAVGLYQYAGPVAAAVRAIKAGGRYAAARGLAELMHGRLELPAGVPVTWVPSSRRQLKERGFDLPQLLAGPEAVSLLSRIADRPDQTMLDPVRRRQNPWGSFAPLGRAPPAMILVDDVRTTGTTALAAATILRSAGAHRVLVATLAVAGGQAGQRAAWTTQPHGDPGCAQVLPRLGIR